MTEFLMTRDGALIAEHAIVRISPLIIRPTGCYFEIDYNHGQEARSTAATEDAVNEFLEAML